MDFGFVSGEAGVGHFSLYPFTRFSVFAPFPGGGGWYAGAGAGFMHSSYTFSERRVSGNNFLADMSTGFIFRNGITVSYTLRTEFRTVNNKVSFGYLYRFK